MPKLFGRPVYICPYCDTNAKVGSPGHIGVGVVALTCAGCHRTTLYIVHSGRALASREWPKTSDSEGFNPEPSTTP